MSLASARIQIVLGWLLMIVGALVTLAMNSAVGTAIWAIGALLLILVSILYFVSKIGGGRLGGA